MHEELTSSVDRKFPSIAPDHKTPAPAGRDVSAFSLSNGLSFPGAAAAHQALPGHSDLPRLPSRLLRFELSANQAFQFAAPSIRRAPLAARSASAASAPPLRAGRAHARPSVCPLQSNPEWWVQVSAGESRS